VGARSALGAVEVGMPVVVKDYPINIFWSGEDGGYIADVPDLVACPAFGTTAADALAEVERAKTAWLEAAEAEGKRIPQPRWP
jgi:predicted RNase H-like HicB family nuclease